VRSESFAGAGEWWRRREGVVGEQVEQLDGAVEVGAGGGRTVEAVARLPRVRAYQREVLEDAGRFMVLLWGRRWGKTKVGVVAACAGHGPVMEVVSDAERSVPEGYEWQAKRWRGALQGARIGWVVPSDDHPSALDVWRDLKKAVGAMAIDPKGKRQVGEERRLIELAGGGSVQLWSGYDPDGLRGPYFDGVVVDECSLQSAKLWEALRPTLSDYGGWALLLGTVPEDVASHWFVGLHRYALSDAGRSRGWATWRRPSAENGQLPAEDLEEARETLGQRTFLREYGAELVSAEGGIWKEAWLRRYDELPPALEFQRVEVFLDAAWRTGVSNDFSCCQAWGKTRSGYYLLGELHGKWESPELRRRVVAFREEMAREYPDQVVALVVETAGGGAVAAQELREAYDFPVVEWEVKGQTKVARCEAVTPLAEGGKVWVPSEGGVNGGVWVREWVSELIGFPQLKHDDRVDACVMALSRLRGYAEPYRAVVAPPRIDLDRVAF
jgi:predicted phage terminase large subunit-like protein